MIEVKEITINGATICVCTPHERELCYRCGVNFVDMNKEAIEASRNADRVEPTGTSLGVNRLPAGTNVFFPTSDGSPMDSRPIVVKGVKVDDDRDSFEFGLECYLLDFGGGELSLAPVEDIHDRYKVRVAGGDLVAAGKFLAGETAAAQFGNEDVDGDEKYAKEFAGRKKARGGKGGIPVLILGGLSQFYLDGDIYAQALVDGFWAASEPKDKWDVTLRGVNKASVKSLTNQLHKFNIVILANAQEHDATFFVNTAWTQSLIDWAQQPHHLLCFFGGEGGSLVALFKKLGKSWTFEGDSYAREDHKPQPNMSRILPPNCNLGRLASSPYNVKASRISNVATNERVFANRNQTAMAYGKCGQGNILFQGDVNFEDSSLAMIKAVAESFYKSIPPNALRAVDTVVSDSALAPLSPTLFPDFAALSDHGSPPSAHATLFLAQLLAFGHNTHPSLIVTTRTAGERIEIRCDGLFPAFSMQPGVTVVIANADAKVFADGMKGVELDEWSQLSVVKASLEHVETAIRCLMDPNKSRCCEVTCKSVEAVNKRCGGCKAVKYCSAEHQKMSWVGGHKRVCAHMGKVQELCDKLIL
ncbi:hypothetical protein HDU98_011607 [Podochytrium sp. JEL0797]|nr:hypothetical protein HDU98_011607 [Podochytrium sp. JEL0797]